MRKYAVVLFLVSLGAIANLSAKRKPNPANRVAATVRQLEKIYALIVSYCIEDRLLTESYRMLPYSSVPGSWKELAQLEKLEQQIREKIVRRAEIGKKLQSMNIPIEEYTEQMRNEFLQMMKK